MKRSEALKKLKLETENWMSNPPDIDELNLILITLENLGMMPPQYIYTHDGFTMCKNAWEDEE